MTRTDNIQITDGLPGYLARPARSGSFPAIVVLMEAYGITGHIRGVCERFAKLGLVAVAPDILHGEVYSYTDVDKVMARIPTVKDDLVMEEIGATLDWLESQDNVRKGNTAVIGFCMGGRLALLAGCRHSDRLKAVVSFYGGGIAPEGDTDRFGRTPPIGEVAKLNAPLFLGYGAEDAGIPPAEHARIVQALSAGKKRYCLAVYPNAGHAFLCEERQNYAPQAADRAWYECTDFLAAQLS
ncbi:MAG TPA: dienelactone hydrolase family protein [Gammaproteobacteria bacterium]|nr:dienelactone hydrolase family protein [Gammaproteobacteria bacterium]